MHIRRAPAWVLVLAIVVFALVAVYAIHEQRLMMENYAKETSKMFNAPVLTRPDDPAVPVPPKSPTPGNP